MPAPRASLAPADRSPNPPSPKPGKRAKPKHRVMLTLRLSKYHNDILHQLSELDGTPIQGHIRRAIWNHLLGYRDVYPGLIPDANIEPNGKAPYSEHERD